jgi:hypothetical protein
MKSTSIYMSSSRVFENLGSDETVEVLRTPATAINDQKCMMKRPDRCVRNCVEVMMGLREKSVSA